MRDRNRAHAALTVAALALMAGCGSGETDTSAADETDSVVSTAIDTDSPADTATDPAPATTTADATDGTDGSDGTEGSEPAGSAANRADDAPVTDEATGGAPVSDMPGVIDVALTDAERTAADDPIAQAIVSAFPPGFAPPSDEQASCVGGKIVNELGTDRLAELGITAESVDVFGGTAFTADEVDSMVDILFECVDVQTMVASMFAPSAGPETADCFADFVDETLIRDLAGPFLGGGAIDADFFLEQVQAANAACLANDS